jgi:hypothetical protein
MFWQGTPPHKHYIQEVNVVIKMLSVKDNFVINLRKRLVHFSFNFNLKFVRFYCWTLYYVFYKHNGDVTPYNCCV